jgi:hypothetical protein
MVGLEESYSLKCPPRRQMSVEQCPRIYFTATPLCKKTFFNQVFYFIIIKSKKLLKFGLNRLKNSITKQIKNDKIKINILLAPITIGSTPSYSHGRFYEIKIF